MTTHLHTDAAPDGPGVVPHGLGQEHFIPLAIRGFGDPWNSYIQSMAWFDDHLYCGTVRAANCFLYARKVGRPKWDPWPTRCPDTNIGDAIDLRAQIWRFSPAAASWQKIHSSPVLEGTDGRQFPRDISYRSMAVLKAKKDSKPTLYVNTFASWRSGQSATILRSEDGVTFEPVFRPGAGLQGVSSYRTLKSFKGRIYTTAVGQGSGLINASSNPVVYECEDPTSEEWRPVSEPGFGDPENVVIFEMEVFNGHLYAGTGNYTSGLQLWKTDAEGPPPYRWQPVLKFGAYRGVFNQGVAAMCAFNDGLYISGCVQDGGYDRVNRIGPAAPELIRVNPDDSWDLVVGTPRLTPAGLKEPTSGYHPGFNDITNGYFWRMCVHDGRIYVGTLNWAVYLPYVNRSVLPRQSRQLLDGFGVDEIVERQGGFDLWSSADGYRFDPVTVSGFRNPYNCGARTLASTPIGLAVGTVNPFGPEVADKSAGAVRYVPNPRGGAEVWIGALGHEPAVELAPPCGAVDPGSASEWRLPPVDTDLAKRIRFVSNESNDTARFEIDGPGLRERGRLIDQMPLILDSVVEARALFELQVHGVENIPRDGPVLFLGNNPFAPLLIESLPVAAHTIYTLDAIAHHRHHPARVLVTLKYFELAEQLEFILPVLQQLGYVPATFGNGIRLLEMGEAVLCHPEEVASEPPYGLRAFSPMYVEMALKAKAPVVPIVFLGTHESHLLIQKEGRQILVNKRQRMETTFRMKFLPPIDVGSRTAGKFDASAIEKFCEELRTEMQRIIDAEKRARPMVELVEQLQRPEGIPAAEIERPLIDASRVWSFN